MKKLLIPVSAVLIGLLMAGILFLRIQKETQPSRVSSPVTVDASPTLTRQEEIYAIPKSQVGPPLNQTK